MTHGLGELKFLLKPHILLHNITNQKYVLFDIQQCKAKK